MVSKADFLKKMNIDTLSKATTKRSTWKFILSARKKSFSYPRQAVTLYLSGSRRYHDRQSIKMMLWGYRVCKHFDIYYARLFGNIVVKYSTFISLNCFLAVKQYAFLTIYEGSAIKVFPQIWTFSALLIITFQSLYKQTMFFMQVCTFFK